MFKHLKLPLFIIPFISLMSMTLIWTGENSGIGIQGEIVASLRYKYPILGNLTQSQKIWSQMVVNEKQ
jgi:hypothetical protein